MTIRPTQTLTYELVRRGLNFNFAKLIRAQEQVSSGKRILRPSDDPVGTSASLALRRQLGDVSRYRAAVSSSKPLLETGTSALEESGQLLAEARQLVVQGLNGSLNDSDRASIGSQLELLKERLIELGNSRSGDRYLFGGTSTRAAPYSKQIVNGREHVVYSGNESEQRVVFGLGVEVAVNVPGSELFGRIQATGTEYAGLTGARPGTTADEGVGYEYITVRHDATTAASSTGIALVGGGANDTFMGDRTLTIDAVQRTVRLGSGPITAIPAATSAELTDVRILDENGAELHLDFTSWSGVDESIAAHGVGSISLDGTTFSAMDFSDTDFELSLAAPATTIHVDLSAIRRAGTDLVTFGGTANAFEVLAGMAEDLHNVDGLDTAALQQRLRSRLGEFDRNYDNLLIGLGTLGGRSERLVSAESRLDDLDVHLKGLLSDVEDVDLSATILQMTKAEQTLNLAQATGSRLIQNTLLDYLR